MSEVTRQEAEELVEQAMLEVKEYPEAMVALEKMREELIAEAEELLLDAEKTQEPEPELEPTSETNRRQSVQKQLLEKGANKVRLSKSKTPQKASPAKKPYTRNSFIPNKDQQANKNNVTIHRGSAGPKSG